VEPTSTVLDIKALFHKSSEYAFYIFYYFFTTIQEPILTNNGRLAGGVNVQSLEM
jgi:hypothetical protein